MQGPRQLPLWPYSKNRPPYVLEIYYASARSCFQVHTVQGKTTINILHRPGLLYQKQRIFLHNPFSSSLFCIQIFTTGHQMQTSLFVIKGLILSDFPVPMELCQWDMSCILPCIGGGQKWKPPQSKEAFVPFPWGRIVTALHWKVK